jgi:hypothetical protein
MLLEYWERRIFSKLYSTTEEETWRVETNKEVQGALQAVNIV